MNGTAVAEGKTGRLIEPCGWRVATVDGKFEPWDMRLSQFERVVDHGAPSPQPRAAGVKPR